MTNLQKIIVLIGFAPFFVVSAIGLVINGISNAEISTTPRDEITKKEAFPSKTQDDGIPLNGIDDLESGLKDIRQELKALKETALKSQNPKITKNITKVAVLEDKNPIVKDNFEKDDSVASEKSSIKETTKEPITETRNDPISEKIVNKKPKNNLPSEDEWNQKIKKIISNSDKKEKKKLNENKPIRMADGKKIKTSSKTEQKINSSAKGYKNKPFYVNIAFSGQRIDLEQTNGTCCTTSDSLSDEKHKDQEAGMKVGFGYDFRINHKTTIRLGLDYDPIKNTTTYKTTNLTWSNEADLKFRFSDQIDLFLAPTYMLTDSLSIYFKAGYSSMAAEWGDGGSKQRLHGYIIGLGFDNYFSNDFFLYNSVTASKFSKDDLKGTLVSGGMQANTFADFDFMAINYDVGIGYRF